MRCAGASGDESTRAERVRPSPGRRVGTPTLGAREETRGTSALELAKKTEAATLGEVDAFLSHSWRDEDAAPGQKYAALEAWAARFEAAHGRGPTCWLDKACIKQDSIDEALACLPVFLAGCKRMLDVAGVTYTRRLWYVLRARLPFAHASRAIHPPLSPPLGAGA